MPIPQQASWLVRKLIGAREIVDLRQTMAQRNYSMMRQFYHQILGQLPRVKWKAFMFRNEARAKAKFTMWMFLQNKLLTRDRLVQWGMSVDTVCSLCQIHNESRNHHFVECVFAQKVWNKVLMWLQIQPHGRKSWDQHWRWAMKNAKGKSQAAAAFKIVYAEIIHLIWCERNNRVFEKTRRDVDDIARTIACVCNVRANAGTRILLQQLKF
ncbi:uncharacterized protein LOC142180934 [Nicotiana tabacum]|uniref:Uncharacterized protein LOC142180934 n=1 Tax=Nicotiana tabacum TaxID=4097 RepID=A0AC58UI31_TOBAC